MIVYGKTSVKSRPCAARIFIRDSGEMVLSQNNGRLYERKCRLGKSHD